MRRFRGDASFATYLHRIVVNVAYEHLERRRRGRGRNEPLDDRQLETLIAPGASPEQRAREREELRRVFALLDRLSPEAARRVRAGRGRVPAARGSGGAAGRQRAGDQAARARRAPRAGRRARSRRHLDKKEQQRHEHQRSTRARRQRNRSAAAGDEPGRRRAAPRAAGVGDRWRAGSRGRRPRRAPPREGAAPALALADRRGRGRRGGRARARPPTARTARAGADARGERDGRRRADRARVPRPRCSVRFTRRDAPRPRPRSRPISANDQPGRAARRAGTRHHRRARPADAGGCRPRVRAGGRPRR